MKYIFNIQLLNTGVFLQQNFQIAKLTVVFILVLGMMVLVPGITGKHWEKPLHKFFVQMQTLLVKLIIWIPAYSLILHLQMHLTTTKFIGALQGVDFMGMKRDMSNTMFRIKTEMISEQLHLNFLILQKALILATLGEVLVSQLNVL